MAHGRFGDVEVDRDFRFVAGVQALRLHHLVAAHEFHIQRFQFAADEPERAADARLLLHVAVGLVAGDAHAHVADGALLAERHGVDRHAALAGEKARLRGVRQLEVVAIAEDEQGAGGIVRAQRRENRGNRAVHARARARGLEIVRAFDRRGVFAELVQPRIVIGRRAVGLDEARIGQQRPRGLGARALLHILLRHAARIVHRHERHAIRHRRRNLLQARWLEQEQEHERPAEQAEKQERPILRRGEPGAHAAIDGERQDSERRPEQGDGGDWQDRVENEVRWGRQEGGGHG